VAAVDGAAARLAEKLRRLDVQALPISDYMRKYLTAQLRQLLSTVQRYAYIMAWSLADVAVPLGEIAYLDYGAGIGMLALLARELGVGSVLYNDIYDVSCENGRAIARALRAEADHYILGGIDDVAAYVKGGNLRLDVVASFDVIEHVYDVEDLFRKLPLLSDGPLTILMATSANALNPFTRRALMGQQRRFEFEDRLPEVGQKQRDGLRAWSAVRREMIQAYDSELAESDAESLVRATRGQMGEDIRSAIETFRSTGELPPEPRHPTNTCDPYTGNWTEHLMDPDHVLALLRDGGFRAEVLPGYYGPMNSHPKRCIGTDLNAVSAPAAPSAPGWPCT